MSSYRNQPWSSRFAVLGDESEGKFEERCEREKRGYMRWGLDRPNIAVHMLPARVRYAPDFLTSKSFVECQGFGRDSTVKLKLDKWGALHWWRDVFPVDLFLWDSASRRECLVALGIIDDVLADGHATLESFPEGKSYFAVPADIIFDRAES